MINNLQVYANVLRAQNIHFFFYVLQTFILKHRLNYFFRKKVLEKKYHRKYIRSGCYGKEKYILEQLKNRMSSKRACKEDICLKNTISSKKYA